QPPHGCDHRSARARPPHHGAGHARLHAPAHVARRVHPHDGSRGGRGRCPGRGRGRHAVHVELHVGSHHGRGGRGGRGGRSSVVPALLPGRQSRGRATGGEGPGLG